MLYFNYTNLVIRSVSANEQSNKTIKIICYNVEKWPLYPVRVLID